MPAPPGPQAHADTMTEPPDNVRARSRRWPPELLGGKVARKKKTRRELTTTVPRLEEKPAFWGTGTSASFSRAAPRGGAGTWQGAALRGPRRAGSLPTPLQALSPAR